MAKTVNGAFNYFKKDVVNLDPSINDIAKSSKNWLLSQKQKFEDLHEFPQLYDEIDIQFGSYARKTKIRELDDIDLMIGLDGQSSTYHEHSNRVEIIVGEEAHTLKKFCHTDENTLNSKRIINKFVAACTNVPQYSEADIKRNQEAATLKLKSYTWNFDIVPCFLTKPNIQNETFYLIPDGNGHWKKTNPKIDRKRVSSINQQQGGHVLQVIRIMKYWNRRPVMPTMSSYLLETMILDYYDTLPEKFTSGFIDLEIPKVLSYINKNIWNNVLDPKGIQGNINNLSTDEKSKLQDITYTHYHKAIAAKQFEDENNMENSINKWKEIFGSYFPSYE